MTRSERIAKLLREFGYKPCEDVECPWCARDLGRKCPDVDSWDTAWSLVEEAMSIALTEF